MAEPRYRVVLTEDVKVVIRELVSRAAAAGLTGRIDAALRTVEQELETRPTAWGDPHRNYPNARLATYLRVHDELAVTYAVHDERPILWLTHVVPVLGHPLRA